MQVSAHFGGPSVFGGRDVNRIFLVDIMTLPYTSPGKSLLQGMDGMRAEVLFILDPSGRR